MDDVTALQLLCRSDVHSQHEGKGAGADFTKLQMLRTQHFVA